MLVCSVSLRERRAGIAAAVAEVATAVDATATGNIIFATLVDAPASVRETLDAYLGEIMLEAASAGDAVNVGLAYAAAVDEAASAGAVADAALGAGMRSAMVMGTCVNSDTSREAMLTDVMGNL